MRLSLILLIVVFTTPPISGVVARSHFSAIQEGYGTFRGIVVDTKGKRIRGAAVKIVGHDVTQRIKPNRNGYFEVTLPAGMYEITVKKSRFATFVLTNLDVKRNGESSQIFRLKSSRTHQ